MPHRRRRLVLLALVTAGCAPAPRPLVPPTVEVIACVDLPRDDVRSHNLSGLAWDPRERLLYAVSDRDRQLTILRPSPDLTGVAIVGSIALAIDVAARDWDGEGVALAGDWFYVGNEVPPAIFKVDRQGRVAERIAVLPDFGPVRDNLGMESLGVTPDGRYLFYANEQAFDGDGPTSDSDHGTRVRIVRLDLKSGRAQTFGYQTEPVFAAGLDATNGVTDVAPLSAERVLVTERAYVRDLGNEIRIFRVDLGGRGGKELVVDFALLPDEKCSPPPGPQRRRILENYEGIALGPTLPDGRRVVFAVSDDNHRAGQVPRLVILSLPSASAW